MITLLLEKGADINAQGGHYGNALQAASYFGHYEIVTLFLEKDADINARGGPVDNALQAASYKTYYDIVTLLLEKDANEQRGEYSNGQQDRITELPGEEFPEDKEF
jgi:ankyrin repeat protein